MQPFNKKLFMSACALMAALRIFSWLGHMYEQLSVLCVIIVLAGVIFLTLRDTWWGIVILFSEIVIGSQGRMLTVDVAGISISIRQILFLWVMAFFAYKEFPYRSILTSIKEAKAVKILVPLSIALIAGFIVGFLKHPFMDVFLDGNGYVFLLLLFPLISMMDSVQRIQDIITIVLAGCAYMFLESLVYSYVFFHGFGWQTDWYFWLRDSRLAEITPISKNFDFYRIFFQSYIYAGIALIASLIFFLAGKISNRYFFAFSAAALTLLITSASRSYWLALAIVIPMIFIIFAKNLKKTITTFALFAGGLIASLALILAVTNVPFPQPTSWYAFNILGNRINITSEAAASSRWKMLPPLRDRILESPLIGSGFGTRVMYNSDDPRIKNAENPDGITSTFAFEWGILDSLTEVGLLGVSLLAYAWISINRRVWKLNLESKILVISNIFILLVHITSPYLNHPLGLAMLSVSGAVLIAYNKKPENLSGLQAMSSV